MIQYDVLHSLFVLIANKNPLDLFLITTLIIPDKIAIGGHSIVK
jgi:hypothetical protein